MGEHAFPWTFLSRGGAVWSCRREVANHEACQFEPSPCFSRGSTWGPQVVVEIDLLGTQVAFDQVTLRLRWWSFRLPGAQEYERLPLSLCAVSPCLFSHKCHADAQASCVLTVALGVHFMRDAQALSTPLN